MPFPVFITSFEEKILELQQAYQVSSQREMMRDPSLRQVSSLGPIGRTAGQLFSSPSLLQDGVHMSTVPPCERLLPSSRAICQSRNEKSLPPTSSSHSEEQSTAFMNHKGDIKDSPPWCTDPISDLFDFSDIVSVQNGQMENSVGIIASTQSTGKSDWSYWDPLISNEDTLGTFWNDLTDDVTAAQSKQKV